MPVKTSWAPVSEKILDRRAMAELHGRMQGIEAKERALWYAESADDEVRVMCEVQGIKQYWQSGDPNPVNKHARKGLNSLSDAAGGFATAGPLVREFMGLPLADLDDLRSISTIITEVVGDSLAQPTGTSPRPPAVWARETDSHQQTGTIGTAMEVIPVHSLYCQLLATSQLLQTLGGEWLAKEAFKILRVTEGKAFISGNGVGQPAGVVTDSRVTQIHSGNASLLTADGIAAAFEALALIYQGNGTWIANSRTLTAIRQLKDSAGMPIFKAGTFGIAPPTILGRPVLMCPSMPDIAPGSTPLVFGDFSYYWVADKTPMATIIDVYSNKPSVTYDFTRRVGAQIVNASAFVKQLIST